MRTPAHTCHFCLSHSGQSMPPDPEGSGVGVSPESWPQLACSLARRGHKQPSTGQNIGLAKGPGSPLPTFACPSTSWRSFPRALCSTFLRVPKCLRHCCLILSLLVLFPRPGTPFPRVRMVNSHSAGSQDPADSAPRTRSLGCFSRADGSLLLSRPSFRRVLCWCLSTLWGSSWFT